MDETENINQILNQLYDQNYFTVTQQTPNADKANTILLRLHTEGLADITTSEASPGMKRTLFSISSKGRQLIESLPEDYLGRPYTYQLKLDQYEQDKIESRKLLEEKQIRSVVSTNRFTTINIFSTIIFTAIIVWLQVDSKKREIQIDKREMQQRHSDSLAQQERLKVDSMLYNLLLQKEAKLDSVDKKYFFQLS